MKGTAIRWPLILPDVKGRGFCAGKAIAGHKLDCLATKFAFKFTATGIGMDGSREYVKSAVEASLKRLNVKQIDLYYQHRVDRSLPIEETWQALKVCSNGS